MITESGSRKESVKKDSVKRDTASIKKEIGGGDVKESSGGGSKRNSKSKSEPDGVLDKKESPSKQPEVSRRVCLFCSPFD